MSGKNLKKKETLRRGPASLLKISLWDSFQFLIVQTNHLLLRKWNIDSNELFQITYGLKRLMGNVKRLHQLYVNYNIVYRSI